RETKEKTKHDDFTYLWEQRKFNPISNEMQCHIHFKFPDGSKMRRAFSYDWRIWTLPEIRETLAEAGFAKSTVYWEGTDEETGEGNDIYTATEKGEDDPSWIVYVSAEK
ncbi:MAG: class I SAM-dependent methyltransferase, partial [bacterium]